MFLIGEMFDGPHLIYIVASLSVTVLILYLAVKFLKKQHHKDLFLKGFGLLTLFLHLLPLWVEYLRGDQPIATASMLFPIYFCNLSMILLIITAFWENKSGKAFKRLATFTAYAGLFGAFISLIYPDYYLGQPKMWNLGIMKSMLSHSTMMVGCLYLMFGKYFEIKLKDNVITFSFGLLGVGLVGVLVNTLFKITGRAAPNSMYLQAPPLEEAPFLNAYVIAIALVGIVALISFVVEHRARKKLLLATA